MDWVFGFRVYRALGDRCIVRIRNLALRVANLNPARFVFKAHRLFLSLNSRPESKKERKKKGPTCRGAAPHASFDHNGDSKVRLPIVG